MICAGAVLLWWGMSRHGASTTGSGAPPGGDTGGSTSDIAAVISAVSGLVSAVAGLVGALTAFVALRRRDSQVTAAGRTGSDASSGEGRLWTPSDPPTSGTGG